MKKFDLKERVFIITGGTGLLGVKHAEAIAENGGIPIILDLKINDVKKVVTKIMHQFSVKSFGIFENIFNILSSLPL